MLSQKKARVAPPLIGAFNLLSRIFIFLSLFALSFIGIDFHQAPAPGVITELRCDEGTGTTTADASGNGHNGVLTNGPTWGPGKYGQGINLDGTNDYVNLADHADYTLNPAISYTWSAWVKNNNFNQWSTVWSQTLSATNFFYFYAHTSNDAEAGPVTNGISVYWYNGNNRVVLHSNNNVLTAGQWSYITVTYNAALAQASRFTIYVNGNDVTNRSDVVSSGTITSIDPTNIRIGSNQPYGEYLNGSVDEVRYYRRLLSVSEIQDDMNIGNVVDTEAPAVSITAPAAGTVSGTINVNANASDNVGVVGVQFKLDGANLGAEDISAPYSVSWNTVTASNGNHSLTAVARDAAGNTTTSAAVLVNVNNDTQAPTVSITSPSPGIVLGTIDVNANASDNVGVVGVQFLLDGNNLGAEDLTAPYSISWNTTTIADGPHTLTARARDAAGNTTTSAAIAVTVQNTPPDTQAPSVNITSPSGGTVTGTINVNANASDNVGVVGVQFLLDGNNLGAEDLSSPYSISWNTTTVSNGPHTLTARARDAAGNNTISSPVAVTVSNTNLVAAFGFNENSGTIANDNSGNGNNGTLTNGPVWSAAGKFGAAILFDGTNDLVDVNDANSLDLTNGMTLEAWVNPSNVTGYKTVICKENGTNNLAYALSANNNTSGAANQRPNTRIRIGSTTTTVTGTTKLALNTWTHIASTYDGAVLRLYINGVQVSTTNVTGNMATTTNLLRIGGSPALGTQYFAGLIDEVRIYNRALSQSEIQTDMNTPIAPDITSPIVSITAPAAGNVSGTINVTADASDNIGVVGVQFQLDGVNLGVEDLSAPYSVSWNTTTVGNGPHTLTAIARDAAGNTTISAGVTVTVNNDTELPSVTITEPAAGTVAGTINVSADASDNVGVVGVQFLLNGANLGAEDLTPPYSISWNTTSVIDGNYTLTARARDAAGNIRTSSGVIVNVLNNPPDTEFPVVTITAPAAGNVSGTLNITASASDNVGVVGVQFLINNVNFGAEDLIAPYSISWNTTTLPNGSYTLTAKARDAAGNITTSAGVVVNINNQPDTELPLVSITAPAAGNVSGTINVTASASDNVGVVGVQFLLDGVNLGAEDLTSPYSISWNTTTVSNGPHTLTAVARDAAGNTGSSLPVNVAVNNDITPPSVSITAPAAGLVSGTINVSADATDNIGVVGVQFLLDGVNLGSEDLTAPYSISWNTAGTVNGSHTLTAKARDAAGNVSTSSPVVVNVNNVTNLITAIHFNEGSGTSAADVSGKNHHGTLTSSTWVAGKYGQAVNFNGSSSYVNIPDHPDFTLNPSQSYTWSAWVKNTNFNQWGTVWAQTVDVSNFFYFYAHSTNDADAGPVTNGISVYWWTNNGTSKVVLHSNNNVLTAGQWSHVAITYNGSAAQNSRFTIYVNGVDVTNRTDVVSTGTLATIDPNSIRIGANQPWGDYLNAAVDEVRFYSRLLTAAEIQTDMNTPIGVDDVPPTVSITSPSNGATVTGTINVTASASDNIGVAGVQFLLDGVNLGAEVTAPPYSVSWNTTTAGGGNHVLTARARDAANNTTTSSPVSVTVPGDFTFNLLNPSRNVETTGTADYGVSVVYVNGFTSNNVVLSVTGMPSGITASYVTNPLTDQGQTQLHVVASNATPGTYTLNLSATAQSITHTQQAVLIVNGPADFTLSSSPSVQTVTAGSGTSYSITVGEIGDFVSPVTLSVQGLPSGANASFNPGSVIPVGGSTLTITTSAATPSGSYTLTLQGASGTFTHSISITLTVSSAPPVTWPVTNIASGWVQPIGACFSKNGQKLFVWEKRGKVFVCNRNPVTQVYDKQATPVIDISPEVGDWGDHGLMGFALDPNFDTNGLIYLLYVVDRHYLLNFGTPNYNPNTPDNVSEGQATIGRITRYKTITSGTDLVTDLSTRAILLGETKSTGIPILHDSHGLGTLAFAADGTLLASAGDGADYNTTDAGSDDGSYFAQALSDGIIRTEENVGSFRSQMINCHNGKILRLDPATGDGVSSNPFYDPAKPHTPKSRVWAFGFRNPFRFSIKPGTGSTNPATGDIGEIYIGDVGNRTYEELNIVKAAGSNCGWPLFEGQLYHRKSHPSDINDFVGFTTQNKDEPNPLFGTGGCTQQYFMFRDLVKQATPDGSTTIYNPCNTSIPIGTGNRYVHRRPVIDWKHDVDSARVGIFINNNAGVAQIGSAASGVTGNPFRGNCSIGGFWYTGNLFPANFRNTYFHADFGSQWIKAFTIGFTDVLQKVENFTSGIPAIVCLVENPLDGTLVYVDIGVNAVKSIGYGGNQAPVVKMSSDVTYGPATLNVNFSGSQSFDPDGGNITYAWNFGDNTTSTVANPSHSFTAPAGTPKKFVVTLTVKDNQNATATDSIIISVNNTPPNVHITSPVNNSLYNIGPDSVYSFTAVVTDLEHSPSQLKYEWQKVLRHDNHEHPGAIDTARNTTGSIARVGCNGDDYYWLIRLKVTDAAGLSTMDSSKIFPNCSSARMALVLRNFSVSQESGVNLVKWMTDVAPQIESFDVERSDDGVHFVMIDHQSASARSGNKEYGFNDNNFPAGEAYYRLRMNEIGDVVRYSAVVKTFTGVKESLAIMPNPATGNFALRYSAAESGMVTIRIADLGGRIIHTIRETVNKGQNIIYLQNMPSWKAGIYLVSVQQGRDVQRGKLLYQVSQSK